MITDKGDIVALHGLPVAARAAKAAKAPKTAAPDAAAPAAPPAQRRPDAFARRLTPALTS